MTKHAYTITPGKPHGTRSFPAPVQAMAIASMIGLLSLLLGGCSWFGESTPSPSPARETGTAQPLPAPQQHGTPASTTASRDWSPGTTLADQRLERIYNLQVETIRQIEERPENFSQAERDRLLDNLLSQYQAFTFDNPDFVYGYILYGKLLRQVGDRDAANVAFAKANQLDPQIAVVKQQIGNYLAEEGNWLHAVPYFMTAIDLEPYNAVYHYQLGELLYRSRAQLMQESGMTARMVDNEMLEAFSNAARLDADNRVFMKRYAEAFFDVEEPDWQAASNIWRYLEQSSHNQAERDLINLQRARVLIAMGQMLEARNLLNSIDRPALQEARLELLRQTRVP